MKKITLYTAFLLVICACLFASCSKNSDKNSDSHKGSSDSYKNGEDNISASIFSMTDKDNNTSSDANELVSDTDSVLTDSFSDTDITGDHVTAPHGDDKEAEESTVVTISSSTENTATDTEVSLPSLCIEKTSAKAGETVSVRLNIMNNPGIAGMLLQLEYSEKILLRNASSGTAFSSLAFTLPGEFQSPCKFSWDSENGMAREDGDVMILYFEIPKNAKSGDVYKIDCSYKFGDVYDEDLNNVDLTIFGGTITIQ